MESKILLPLPSEILELKDLGATHHDEEDNDIINLSVPKLVNKKRKVIKIVKLSKI